MSRDNIESMFDVIYETDALIIKAAEDAEIVRCTNDLASLGIPGLPEDYTGFLKIANGVSWNGFEFFGTYQVTVKKSGYILKDIVSFNAERRKSKLGLSDVLILGRFDDDIYVYDFADDKYRALDSLTLTEIDTYDGFEDLFITNISAYTDYDDESVTYDSTGEI